MRIIIIVLLIFFAVHSCHRFCWYTYNVAQTTAGEVKKAVHDESSAFVVHVKNTVSSDEDCTVSLSQDVSQAGLQQGKCRVSGNDSTGNNNKLSVYFISSKAVSRPLTAKLMDEEGREYGRTTITITSKPGEARFYDFVFDNHTDIEDNSRVAIE